MSSDTSFRRVSVDFATDQDMPENSDLISMAIADGEFTEDERLEIMQICRKQGISEKELLDSLRGEDIHIPKTQEEKFNYMSHLISVMNADGKCSPLEIHTLEILAKRIGFNLKEVQK